MPEWLPFSKDIAPIVVSVAAVVVAGAAVFINQLQYKVAKTKLQLELLPKRYDIYKPIADFIAAGREHGHIPSELYPPLIGAHTLSFVVFNNDIENYILEVYERGRKLNHSSNLDNYEVGTDPKKIADEHHLEYIWFSLQDDVWHDKFRLAAKL